MASTYKKVGGRDVIVSLVEVAQTLTGDGSTVTLTKGKWYIPNSKAASGSAIDTFELNIPFLAKSDITLESGDVVLELTDFWDKNYIIGFANSKSLSFSKSSFDVTTDFDDYYDKMTEEQVELSGSFEGFKLLKATDKETAIVKVNREFTNITIQTDEGEEVLTRTNKKLYLAFVYSKTKPTTGDTIDITFTPVSLTSNAENSSYGSGTTQNISFEGNSYSEFGALPAKAVVVY